MKKLILTLLLIFAVALTLASCDNGKNEQTTTTVDAVTTVEEATTATEQATTVSEELVTTVEEVTTAEEITTVEETTTEESTTEEITTEEITTEEETTVPIVETDIAALGEVLQTTPEEVVERKALDGDQSTEYVSAVGATTNYIVGFDKVYNITRVVLDLGESSGSIVPFITVSDDLGNPNVYTALPGTTAYSDTEIEITVNDDAKYVFIGLVCGEGQFVSIKELHVYTDEVVEPQ